MLVRALDALPGGLHRQSCSGVCVLQGTPRAAAVQERGAGPGVSQPEPCFGQEDCDSRDAGRDRFNLRSAADAVNRRAFLLYAQGLG